MCIEKITLGMKYLYRWFKTPSFLFAISLTCLVVVLLPTKLQEALGYIESIKPIKGYLGLLGVAFFVFWVTSFAVHYAVPILRWLSSYSRRTATLKDLSSDEKQYLAKYLKDDCSCLPFCPDDGVINMLMLKNIVFTPSNIGSYEKMDYCLQPWVYKICRKDIALKREIIKEYFEIL